LKETTPADRVTRRPRSRASPLTPLCAILLPLTCGLIGGYLDLLIARPTLRVAMETDSLLGPAASAVSEGPGKVATELPEIRS